MTARKSVLSAFALAAFTCTFAHSQSTLSPTGGQTTTFELHLGGKPVGKDVYTISKSKQGFKLVGHLKGQLHGTDLDFKNALSYSEDFTYLDFALVAQDTNQQTSYLPSKDRKEITIAYAGAGRTSSRFEPISLPDPLVILPAFDAGAAQALLLQAVTHPSAKNLYSVYLPDGYQLGGGRSAPPPAAPGAPPAAPEQALPAGVHCFTAVWIKGGPLTGTLDGKPMAINTYALAFGKFRWIFFADEANNLMQTNVSLLHGSYIREGFKLDAPPPRAAGAN